eukprot:CAMPEP_0119344740 /NCGR_PEP_ID=MMETSP1333-20130426/107126_1 /TAXON_ID=418940 /ORGANISM="Scyphosphaera apsteinii, Strain RCC1455" /LENGTH=472 /DNA_ID=CAMNT_0007357187 /DNA_START=71 /DNA_END=1492 /DNA_ORIENTATION=-
MPGGHDFRAQIGAAGGMRAWLHKPSQKERFELVVSQEDSKAQGEGNVLAVMLRREHSDMATGTNGTRKAPAVEISEATSQATAAAAAVRITSENLATAAAAKSMSEAEAAAVAATITSEARASTAIAAVANSVVEATAAAAATATVSAEAPAVTTVVNAMAEDPAAPLAAKAAAKAAAEAPAAAKAAVEAPAAAKAEAAAPVATKIAAEAQLAANVLSSNGTRRGAPSSFQEMWHEDGKGRLHFRKQLKGVIFGATTQTIDECFGRLLFGLPSGQASMVSTIDSATVIFLFNFTARSLHGIFMPAGPAGFPLERYAWVHNVWNSATNAEELTDEVRYYSGHKFDQQLNDTQVQQLITLFVQQSRKRLQPASSTPEQRPARAAKARRNALSLESSEMDLHAVSTARRTRLSMAAPVVESASFVGSQDQGHSAELKLSRSGIVTSRKMQTSVLHEHADKQHEDSPPFKKMKTRR